MGVSNTRKSARPPVCFYIFFYVFGFLSQDCSRLLTCRVVMSVANDICANVIGIVLVLAMFLCYGSTITAPACSSAEDTRALLHS